MQSVNVHSQETVLFSSSMRWGHPVTVVEIAGVEYLVGAHIAELLRRETFNLYASLKRRRIELWQTDEQLWKLLLSKGFLAAGTTSVTLMKAKDVSEFIVSSIVEKEKRKLKQSKTSKPSKTSKIPQLAIEAKEEAVCLKQKRLRIQEEPRLNAECPEPLAPSSLAAREGIENGS
jgi:hypothetical protein